MRPQVGLLAPLFAAADIYGRPVSLGACYGRPVLLAFNRGAVCPLCNVHLQHLLRRHPLYRGRYGVQVVAVFESAPAVARRYLDRFRAPFPLVGDRAGDAYDLYGVGTSWRGTLRGALRRRAVYREARRAGVGDWRLLRGFLRLDGRKSRLPAEFLLGPDLTLRVAHYGRDSGDFLPLAALDRLLASPMVQAPRPIMPWGPQG